MSGEVSVRPARVGMVFRPSVETIRNAAQLASSAWGGVFFPWIDPGDRTQADRVAEVLSLDALVPLDEAAESEQITRRPGFFWAGMRDAAFGEPMDILPERLQGPGWLLDERPSQLALPRWTADDPLADLFTVWFGGYGCSDYERGLSERFVATAVVHEIAPEEPLPDVAEWLTPIGLTGLRVEYRGWPTSLGFVLIEPNHPEDLALFWNVRAQGDIAFPWPIGSDERLLPAARAWFARAVESDRVERVRSGAGEDLGPDLVFWSRERSPIVPESLQGFAQPRSQELVTSDAMLPMGWSGDHPLDARCSRLFTASLLDDANDFRVAVPRIGAALDHRRGGDVGVVAAHVTVFTESGLPTGWTVAMPRIRELASETDRWIRTNEAFHRPTGDGRAIGVRADADEIVLTPVSSLRLFAKLLAEVGWTVSQSDNGRFASRLIDLLGGLHSEAGNQPALRAVLDQAARSPTGCPLSRLIQTARRNQGEWPGGLGVPPNLRLSYPSDAVYYLLQQQLLRPYLPVKCPSCAITTALSPESLASEIRCDICSKPVALGLALALVGKRSGWVYRLSASVREDRLRETLALMAALSVFSAWTGLSAPSMMPHVLGLQVETEEGAFEIDLALVLEDRGRPTVIVGEVKSWRDDIDENDLTNLTRVQKHFRQKGIECFILAATLKEKLTAAEQTCLRAVCETAPNTLERHNRNLALPIVLARDELSVPGFHERHPRRWVQPRSGLPETAVESCKRNLGLTDIAWRREPKGGAFALEWGEPESAV